MVIQYLGQTRDSHFLTASAATNLRNRTEDLLMQWLSCDSCNWSRETAFTSAHA